MLRRLMASGLVVAVLAAGCGAQKEAGPLLEPVKGESTAGGAPTGAPVAAPTGAPAAAPLVGDAKSAGATLGSQASGRPQAASPGKKPRGHGAPQQLKAPARCTVPAPAPKAGYITISVYFTCEDDQVGVEPRPVPRQVRQTKAVLQAALAELLKGPTAAEKAAGLRSWFSSDTAGMLREVRIQNGRAVVDFRNFHATIPNASTSAGSSQLLAEVGRTIFQFKAVKAADVRFDGSCQAFWGWLQRDCEVMDAARYKQ